MTLSDDIARRRALAEAATPGPWAWEPHGDSGGWSLGVVLDADDRRLSGRLEPGQGNPVECIVDGGVDGTDADAAFIAAHHPALVRALWDVVEAVDQMVNFTDPYNEDPQEYKDACFAALAALAAAMREEQS